MFFFNFCMVFIHCLLVFIHCSKVFIDSYMVPMTEATRIGQEVGVRLLGDEAGHHGCEARVPNTSSSHPTQNGSKHIPERSGKSQQF